MGGALFLLFGMLAAGLAMDASSGSDGVETDPTPPEPEPTPDPQPDPGAGNGILLEGTDGGADTLNGSIRDDLIEAGAGGMIRSSVSKEMISFTAAPPVRIGLTQATGGMIGCTGGARGGTTISSLETGATRPMAVTVTTRSSGGPTATTSCLAKLGGTTSSGGATVATTKFTVKQATTSWSVVLVKTRWSGGARAMTFWPGTRAQTCCWARKGTT